MKNPYFSLSLLFSLATICTDRHSVFCVIERVFASLFSFLIRSLNLNIVLDLFYVSVHFALLRSICLPCITTQFFNLPRFSLSRVCLACAISISFASLFMANQQKHASTPVNERCYCGGYCCCCWYWKQYLNQNFSQSVERKWKKRRKVRHEK